MKKLQEIANGYKELFYKNGNPNFFMMYFNLENLMKNIEKASKLEQDNGLSL